MTLVSNPHQSVKNDSAVEIPETCKTKKYEEKDKTKSKLDPKYENQYKTFCKEIADYGNKGPKKLFEYMNEQNLGIGDCIRTGKGGKYVTIFKIILDNVFNGHQFILNLLDSVVKKIPKGTCVPCFDYETGKSITMYLHPMFKRSFVDLNEHEGKENWSRELNENKMRLLRDLLDIQAKRGLDNNIKKIFQHPVIEVIILKKWEMHQNTYIYKVHLFALFTFLFTFFVRLCILEKNEKTCQDLHENNKNSSFVDCSVFNRSDNLTSNWSWSDNSTKDWSLTRRPLIFKNHEESFYIFVIVMSGFLFIQVLYVLPAFLSVLSRLLCSKDVGEKKKNERREKQALRICLANVGCLLIILLIGCIKNPKELLNYYICLYCIYLIWAEAVQFYFLVIRPAWPEGGTLSNFCAFLKKIIRHRYFNDPENYLEIFCMLGAPFACNTQDIWTKTEDKSEDIYRGIIAIGVFAAWIELVIKLGNVSNSVIGDFIKAFYHSMKSKLLSYMFVCFLLMVSFSMAFWIILDGHVKKTGSNFTTGFWIDLVYMVTMSTGEFNTGDFYEDIQIASKEVKVFAMIFLVGMVILSTITMINLLVAAIINDYGKMMEEVSMENLYFITEYIVEQGEYERSVFCVLSKLWQYTKKKHQLKAHVEPVENFLLQIPVFLGFYTKTEVELIKEKGEEREELFKKKEDTKMEFCPHMICNYKTCKMEPLPIPRSGCWRYSPEKEAKEREPLLFKLLEIRKDYNSLSEEKEESKKQCDYHRFGLEVEFSHKTDTTKVRSGVVKRKTNKIKKVRSGVVKLKTNKY